MKEIILISIKQPKNYSSEEMKSGSEEMKSGSEEIVKKFGDKFGEKF